MVEEQLSHATENEVLTFGMFDQPCSTLYSMLFLCIVGKRAISSPSCPRGGGS